jgi:hypothetical protein
MERINPRTCLVDRIKWRWPSYKHLNKMIHCEVNNYRAIYKKVTGGVLFSFILQRYADPRRKVCGKCVISNNIAKNFPPNKTKLADTVLFFVIWARCAAPTRKTFEWHFLSSYGRGARTQQEKPPLNYWILLRTYFQLSNIEKKGT